MLTFWAITSESVVRLIPFLGKTWKNLQDFGLFAKPFHPKQEVNLGENFMNLIINQWPYLTHICPVFT